MRAWFMALQAQVVVSKVWFLAGMMIATSVSSMPTAVSRTLFTLFLGYLAKSLTVGQCTYNMLAHPSAISSLSLSPSGAELVSAGHDASLRFWSLEKRSCSQEITSHRLMRGEGVCSVIWSQDGRWVVSGGGDGVVKVFSRDREGVR